MAIGLAKKAGMEFADMQLASKKVMAENKGKGDFVFTFPVDYKIFDPVAFTEIRDRKALQKFGDLFPDKSLVVCCGVHRIVRKIKAQVDRSAFIMTPLSWQIWFGKYSNLRIASGPLQVNLNGLR